MSDTPRHDDVDISDADAAALARLADGHLRGAEADALRGRVAAAPSLAAAAARQDQALAALRDAAQERAPLALRERLSAAPDRRRAPRWRLPAILGGLAAAADQTVGGQLANLFSHPCAGHSAFVAVMTQQIPYCSPTTRLGSRDSL